MRRQGIGLFFVVHGLAHSAVGMAAQDLARQLPWAPSRGWSVAIATALFAMAMSGFVAAGLGVWGVCKLGDVCSSLPTSSWSGRCFAASQRARSTRLEEKCGSAPFAERRREETP